MLPRAKSPTRKTSHEGAPLRRPRSVRFVGILLGLYGLALVFLAGLVVLVILQPQLADENPLVLKDLLSQISNFDVVLLGGQVLMGLFMILGGVGVLRMRGWGWLMAIIALGVHLLILLINYWRGTPSYWEMLVSATIIFLVNLQEVHQTLGLVDDPTESTHHHDLWADPDDAHDAHSLLSRRG